MAEIIKPLSNEQTFTAANTFSTSPESNSGWNHIRVVNTGNTAAVVTITNSVSSSQAANLTILPYTETIIRKWANNTATASSSSLLAVIVAQTQ